MAKEIKITIDNENLKTIQDLKSKSQNLSDVINMIIRSYPELLKDSHQLNHLEELGVDNWSEYSRYDCDDEDEDCDYCDDEYDCDIELMRFPDKFTD